MKFNKRNFYMFVIKFTYLYTKRKKYIRKTTFHWVMLYFFKCVGVCNYFLALDIIVHGCNFVSKTLNYVCNLFCVNNSMFIICRFVTSTLSYSLYFSLCLVVFICNNLSNTFIHVCNFMHVCNFANFCLFVEFCLTSGGYPK